MTVVTDGPVDASVDVFEDIVERASDTIGNTRRWARDAHGKQTDKAGHPYVGHLDAVAENVFELAGFDPDLLKAAYLHDTIEDTPITARDLEEEGYSDRTIFVVNVLTKMTNEPNPDYTTRVIKGGVDTILVKLADLYNNADRDRLAVLPAATRERLEEKYFSAIFRLENALVNLGFFSERQRTIDFDTAYTAVKFTYNSGSEWSTRHPTGIIVGDQVRFKADVSKIFTVSSKRVSHKGAYVFQFEETGKTDVILDWDNGKGNYESRWKSAAAVANAKKAAPVHMMWQKRLGLPAGWKYGDAVPQYLHGEKAPGVAE